MSIGYNIETAVVKNMPRLLMHLNKVRPNWCLTYGVPAAIQLRNAGVKNVTVRLYPDGGVNEKLTPDDWMHKFENVRANGFFAEFTNEAGLQTRAILDLLKVAIPRGFKITLPGLATGQPEPGDWTAYNEVLDYLTTYPDQLVLSTHDYFAGYPQLLMAGYDTVEECRQWTPALGKPDYSWWLAGRTICFLSQHQQARGKPMPRMIITELGEGNTGFLKGNVIPTPPYPVSYGYQSMYNEYTAAYSGQHPARTYAKMLIWLDRTIYVPNGVEGVCVYCWGADWSRQPGSEFDWKPFDLELYPDIFIQEFEAYAMSTNPPVSPPVSPPVITNPIPKPAGAGILSTMGNVTPFVNVRQGPGVNYKDVGNAYSGLVCLVYKDPVQPVWVYVEPQAANDTKWQPATAPLSGGWISTDAVSFTAVPVSPPVVTPPPPPPPSQPPVEPPPPIETPPLISVWLTRDELQQLLDFELKRAEMDLAIAKLCQTALERAQGV